MQKPLSKNATNNTDYNVAFLFEYEGCKVYRFYDDGKYIYFTNCAGSVTSVVSDSVNIQNIVRVK